MTMTDVVKSAGAMTTREQQAAALLNRMTLPELQSLKLQVYEAIRLQKAKRKIPVKYRNPNNHKQEWAGRGLPPAWFKNLSERQQKACLVAQDVK